MSRRQRPPRRNLTSRIHRGAEAIVGLFLAVAAVFLLAFAIFALFTASLPGDLAGLAISMAILVPAAYVSGALGVHLLSGRRYPEGGPFPWWFLYLVGGLVSGWGAAKRASTGFSGGAEAAANELFEEGRLLRATKQRRTLRRTGREARRS